MSFSCYFFTTLNALPIIIVATEKTSKPWEPSPYYITFTCRACDTPHRLYAEIGLQ